MNIQTPTSDTFKSAIQKDEYAIGAMLILHSFQTPDEQQEFSTKYQNGMGFNSTDSVFVHLSLINIEKEEG